MTALYLIRHGETAWNREERYQGQTDVPLSPVGIEQAQKLAETMAKRPLTAIYSSDLQRAQETAAAVARRHGLRVIVDQRLREAHYGEWEGKTRDSIQREYPHVFVEIGPGVKKRLDHLIPGAETPEAVRQRVWQSLDEIAARHRQEHVAVVSHGGALRLVVSDLLGPDWEDSHQVRIPNTSVSLIRRSDNNSGSWSLDAVGDISHLGAGDQ